MKNTKTLVLTALMTALTCVATMIIRIPTPTLGYVHPGDGFVLLSGLLLGPVGGTFAAGIGSALADLFSGYVLYAPATLVIKSLVALFGGLSYRHLNKKMSRKPSDSSSVNSSVNSSPVHFALIVSGMIAELFMVLSYFLCEIFLLSASGGSIESGLAAAVTGLLPNLIQGAFGVLIAVVLYPVFHRNIRRFF